jgi:hypothetical protein
MTRSVCLQCGSSNTWGVLNPCRQCGFAPDESDAETFAKCLTLSDHFLAEADLQAIGERIASGLPIHFGSGLPALVDSSALTGR